MKKSIKGREGKGNEYRLSTVDKINDFFYKPRIDKIEQQYVDILARMWWEFFNLGDWIEWIENCRLGLSSKLWITINIDLIQEKIFEKDVKPKFKRIPINNQQLRLERELLAKKIHFGIW